MRCYYEVLGISQSADATAIKKAYRVQALQWHPDKNQHRLAEADEKFKEISNAYEVLSDEHERAWYDSHRQQILKADSHQAGSWGVSGASRPADEEDLFSYFSARCYSGYGDDRKGFYAVYDALFEKLARQEVTMAERRGDADAREAASASPHFGGSTATWAQVSAFYDYFRSFTTLKDFAWSDEHNPAAAPNRKVRRIIEEENQKRRKALRRHYNETVRELASFVRKRDKRVLAHNAEEAAKRAARETEVEAQRKADKAARAAAAAQYREADWITASEARDGATSEEESEAEDLKQVDWQCVICNKLFRSEKALANHERSKKHLEKLAEVRQMLEEEEAQAGGNGTAAASAPPAQPASSEQHFDGNGAAVADTDSEAEVPIARLSKKQQKKKQQRMARQRAAAAAAACGDGTDSDTQIASQPQQVGPLGAATGSDDGSKASEAAELDEDDMLAAMMRSAAGGNQTAAASSDNIADKAVGNSEAAGPVEEKLLAAMLRSAALRQENPAALPSSDEEGSSKSGAGRASISNGRSGHNQNNAADAGAASEASATGKHAKGKRRRAKGNKKDTAAEEAAAQHPELTCSVCGQEFPSRTKLFAHISKAGHARLKS